VRKLLSRKTPAELQLGSARVGLRPTRPLPSFSSVRVERLSRAVKSTG